MVCVVGLDSKSYEQQLGSGAIPEVACPNPSCQGHLLSPHGWYRRYLDAVLVAFRRLRCRRCRVSHALLPEDVCAYQDLKLPVLERAMDAAGGPSAAARAAGQDDGENGVRRARRWRRGRLWAPLELLLGATGRLAERIVELVGHGVGKLVRLRHGLWSRYGYLLGGPVGLFRQGRPRGAPRRASP